MQCFPPHCVYLQFGNAGKCGKTGIPYACINDATKLMELRRLIEFLDNLAHSISIGVDDADVVAPFRLGTDIREALTPQVPPMLCSGPRPCGLKITHPF